MNEIRFTALSSETVRGYRAGQPDAYGLVPEQRVSGGGAPCRHCLRDIEAGEPLLTLAHRPFPKNQPYAETGPIFLHAEACERYPESAQIPGMFLKRPALLIRGYDHDDRIVYGTGSAAATATIDEAARELLKRADVAYVHLRSATTSCFQCRVDRA